MRPILCIAGPTASGKSRWAVELAKTVDGEIINADALQVYRDLQIVSARPDVREMDGVPHHLFGHIDGSVRYSTGAWLKDVVPVILDVLARGKAPILVGGTGLYFKALTEGLSEIPHPEPRAVMEAQRILDEDGIEALRREAETLDPVATAKILGHDPHRLLRVVSVALGTEKPVSQWRQSKRAVLPLGVWRGVVLNPDKAVSYARINARFAAMFESGAVDEVKAMLSRNLSPALPVMKAIGVPQVQDYLLRISSKSEAIASAQQATRRFAKRQGTWFRGQMPDWPKISPQDTARCWNNLPQTIV